MNKKLRALIDRAERLIAEREEANEGIRDLRKEVKGQGYDATQIMRLAQLSYDDKKRAKLATANETLALYNRESGLGFVLGLDDITETDRAATSSAPEGPAEREKPPRPEPIPEPPAGGQPLPAGPTQAVAAPPSAIPAGAPDKPDDGDEGIDPDWERRDGAATYDSVRQIQRDTLVASGAARLHPAEIDITLPDVLRRA